MQASRAVGNYLLVSDNSVSTMLFIFSLGEKEILLDHEMFEEP